MKQIKKILIVALLTVGLAVGGTVITAEPAEAATQCTWDSECATTWAVNQSSNTVTMKVNDYSGGFYSQCAQLQYSTGGGFVNWGSRHCYSWSTYKTLSFGNAGWVMVRVCKVNGSACSGSEWIWL